ncbi:5690_t:CDS:2 [Dentiscutata erythropus]|uniref:5690_t:CDS:1 n=1 Tax=Dentiscutata erythropus TaxID=1348616 RepID=A0A9N9DNV6_9GLOM|nr:5690_t:CDS:2 [Dentiscutata erythropus]
MMLNFSKNKYKSDSLLKIKLHKDANSQTINVEQVTHSQETTETLTTDNKSHIRTKSIGLIFGFSIKSKISKHFHPTFQKAVRATKEKKYQEATEYWTELLQKYPESYSVRCERANANFNQSEYGKALQDLNLAIKQKPSKVKGYYIRLEVNKALKRYDDALSDINFVLYINSKDKDAEFARIQVLIRLKRQALYEDALKSLTSGLQSNPNDVKLLSNRGNVYRALHQYDNALTDFNHALKLYPKNVIALLIIISQIHQLRGSALEELGHQQEAKLALANIMKLQPTNIKVIHQHANLCESLSLYSDSLSDWNKLYNLLDPESNSEFDRKAIKAVLLNRGRILLKLCRYEDALSDFNQGLKLFPQNVSLLCYRAEIYQQLGRYDEALNDLNDSIDQPKNTCQFYVTRAGIYKSLEKYPEAYKDLKMVLESKFDLTSEISYNSYTLGLCYRGSIYRIYKKYDKALVDLNRVIQKDPNNALALCERSVVYREKGQFDDAWKDIEKMLLCC